MLSVPTGDSFEATAACSLQLIVVVEVLYYLDEWPPPNNMTHERSFSYYVPDVSLCVCHNCLKLLELEIGCKLLFVL